MNTENPEFNPLERELAERYQVPPDNLERVVEVLLVSHLNTVEILRDAIDWYNSPASPFQNSPFTRFPDDNKELMRVITDLITCRLKGRSLFDDPYDDFTD